MHFSLLPREPSYSTPQHPWNPKSMSRVIDMAWLEDSTSKIPCSEDPRNFSRLQSPIWCPGGLPPCFWRVSNSTAMAPYCTPWHAFGVYQTLHPWGIGVKCRLTQMVRQPLLRQGLGVSASTPEIVEVTTFVLSVRFYQPRSHSMMKMTRGR